MNKPVTHKTTLKRIVSLLCLSSFVCLAPSAWAGYSSFGSDAMSLASGFTGGTVATGGWAMTVTDATKLVYVPGGSSDSLNRSARGWYAGVTIRWPEGGARDEDAKMQTSRMTSSVAGNGNLSGTALTRTTEHARMHTCMATTTWWGYITPEEAYAKKTGTFGTTLTMNGSNYRWSTLGVNEATFAINFPVDGLELKDNDGVVWFPAVATNAAGKVYGDLNVALKASGTIVSVADAAITQAMTLEDGLIFRKGAYTIDGLYNLTLNGGSYDFNPSGVCTLGEGRVIEQQGDLWVVKTCSHDWSYEVNPAGDTFTATCSKGCSYTPQMVSIAITPATKTYDGKVLTAALTYNKGEAEFKAQTGASVSEIVWIGDKKSAGDQTASVTITDRDGGTHTISNTVTIDPAGMSTASVMLKTTEVLFTGIEQTNAIASVSSVAGIDENDWEIVDKAALYQTGSGYSNCTYTVTLNGKRNYTGTKTVTWTIKAPTRALGDMGRGDFEMSSKLYNDNYGECDQATRTLNVTATTNIIFVNGAWYVGMTVDLPVTIDWLSSSDSVLTDNEHLRVMVSTVPGRTFTGTEIVAGTVTETIFQVKDDDKGTVPGIWGLGDHPYLTTLRWFTQVSPAMIEQAKIDGKDYLEFTMTVGGITFKPYSDATWEGFAYKDFTIKMPVDGFIFKVGRNEFNTANIGNVKFDAAKILLQDGSIVTNACKVDYTNKKYIYTDVADHDVVETKVSDSCWVYACDEVANVTIPNVANQASKVVTLNGSEVEPLDDDKTAYRVHSGDTLMITYTAKAGYVPATAERTMESVTPGATLTDLPVFTWPTFTVQPEELAGAVAHVFTNGVEVASPYAVASNEYAYVWYVADDDHIFANETISNKTGEVKVIADPTVIPALQEPALVLAVAKVGDKKFAQLDNAILGAEDGDTVKLFADCSNKSGAMVSDKSITLDENGFAATNICIAATGKVAIKGATGSANKLRASRPTLFGTLEDGAKVTTDKTYFFVEAFDAFYEDGHEVVATTADGQGGTYLESYPKFADGLAVVATNGTLYALKNITNYGFSVTRNMTIDLAKAANGGPEYSLTVTNAAQKTTGIVIAGGLTDVTFRGGTVVATNVATVIASSADALTLDGVTVNGDSTVGKTGYAVQLTGGTTTITNSSLVCTRTGYALNVSAYGLATSNRVTFLGANTVTGNIFVNAQKAVPVKVAFAALNFDNTSYKLTINACNDQTVITQAKTVYKIVLDESKHPELLWTNFGDLYKLTDGKIWWNKTQGTYYPTLHEANDNANSGDILVACADSVEAEDVHVANGVTLDLYGHTLTAYLDVNGVPFTIFGTNDYSRIVGEVWATNGASLSICGGTYGLVAAYGKNTINIADAIIKCDNENETALQLGSYGERGSSYDEDLAVTVVNSRITGYSAVYLGGGSLTISNSVLTATGAAKLAIDRDNWMGGTGDALVIDQVPGCPITVDIQAGTKLFAAVNSACDQFGWYKTSKSDDDKASATKYYNVDLMAPLGYAWYGDTNAAIRTLVRADGKTMIDPIADFDDTVIARNTTDLTAAYNVNPEAGGKITIVPNTAVQCPMATIELLGSTVLINAETTPDFTYELMTSEKLLNPEDAGALSQWEVLERRAARDTMTTFTTEQKDDKTSGFYTVRLVE